MSAPDALHSRIVALIPSESLKKEIERTGYRLSDADLLGVAYRFAADHDTRIGLLRLLERRFDGELRTYTTELIRVQGEMLESFIKPEQNAVYELHIKTAPDAYDERYLCRTYDDALRMIPLFFREYSCEEEAAQSRCTVVKRRVLSGETGFSEDTLGELDLLPGNRVYAVNMRAYFHRAEGCEGMCLGCVRPCAENSETLFPPFLRHGDAVKCCELSGEQWYGIVLSPGDEPCADYYVIPLDCAAVRYHDFADVHSFHRHVPAPLTERIEEGALPEDEREDYRACFRYLSERA